MYQYIVFLMHRQLDFDTMVIRNCPKQSVNVHKHAKKGCKGAEKAENPGKDVLKCTIFARRNPGNMTMP